MRTTLEIELGVPAGASIDPSALTAQQEAGGLQSYLIGTDRVSLTTKPFAAGEILEVRLSITPAFAGRFATRPLVVKVGGSEHILPPTDWTVSQVGAE
jgi:hypothetical protein